MRDKNIEPTFLEHGSVDVFPMCFLIMMLLTQLDPSITVAAFCQSKMAHPLPGSFNPTPTNAVMKQSPRKFTFNFDDSVDDCKEVEELESSSTTKGVELEISNDKVDRNIQMVRSMQLMENPSIITESSFPIRNVSPHPHPPPITPKGTPTNNIVTEVEVEKEKEKERKTTTTKRTKNKKAFDLNQFEGRQRRQKKQHFSICMRWPSKAYLSLVFGSVLALALLRESYYNASQLQVTTMNTSNFRIDMNIPPQILHTARIPPRNFYAASAFNQSNLMFLCECNSGNTMKRHCNNECKKQWSQSAPVSIFFNASSIGWNIQSDFYVQNDHVHYLVWGETDKWITEWMFTLNVWTIIFSLVLLLVQIWFVKQCIQGRKVSQMPSESNNYFSAPLQRPLSPSNFPNMEGVK